MRFTISLAYRLYNPTNDFKDIKIIHIGDKNQNHLKKCCSFEQELQCGLLPRPSKNSYFLNLIQLKQNIWNYNIMFEEGQ